MPVLDLASPCVYILPQISGFYSQFVEGRHVHLILHSFPCPRFLLTDVPRFFENLLTTTFTVVS